MFERRLWCLYQLTSVWGSNLLIQIRTTEMLCIIYYSQNIYDDVMITQHNRILKQKLAIAVTVDSSSHFVRELATAIYSVEKVVLIRQFWWQTWWDRCLWMTMYAPEDLVLVITKSIIIIIISSCSSDSSSTPVRIVRWRLVRRLTEQTRRAIIDASIKRHRRRRRLVRRRWQGRCGRGQLRQCVALCICLCVWSYNNIVRATRAWPSAPNLHLLTRRYIDVICHAANFIVSDPSNCLFGNGHILYPLTCNIGPSSVR